MRRATFLFSSHNLLAVYLPCCVHRLKLHLADNPCLICRFMRQQPAVFYPQQHILQLLFWLILPPPALQRARTHTPQFAALWFPMISSPWRWFMSCGVSGPNIIIEPGYCSEQSLRKAEGNEEEMTSGRHLSCKSDSLLLLRGDIY